MDNFAVVNKTKKRVGRGVGSGKGFHTTGRGQKGQKSRYTVGVLFEGVKTKKSLLHRLPVLRGKGKFAARPKANIISIEDLNTMPAGEVTIESLVKAGLVSKKLQSRGVKILGNNEVKNKYTVSVAVSQSAREQIEKAGGTIA